MGRRGGIVGLKEDMKTELKEWKGLERIKA